MVEVWSNLKTAFSTRGLSHAWWGISFWSKDSDGRVLRLHGVDGVVDDRRSSHFGYCPGWSCPDQAVISATCRSRSRLCDQKCVGTCVVDALSSCFTWCANDLLPSSGRNQDWAVAGSCN